MSTNRAWRWLVVAALLVTVGGGCWFVLTGEPDHPLGRRNYRRIKADMTRGDVEQILGSSPGMMVPPSDPPAQVQLIEQEGPVDALGGMQGKPEVWTNDRGQIVVFFDSWDQSARVVGKQFYRVVPRPAGRRG
jgi:hypothetical protein